MKIDYRLLHNQSLLPPLLIGIVSLLGICLIVAAAWYPRQNTEAVPLPSLTPFKYLLIATETDIPTLRLETATLTQVFPMSTEASTESTTPFPVVIGQTGISEGEIFTSTSAITPAPIFAESVPITAGTYDAGDSQIIRSGDWATQNSEGAYLGTLLVSSKVGNYVAFSFVGYRMSIGYQGSATAGDLKINIDGSEETLNQQAANEWFSQELEPTTHYVILTHENGGTLNLDYIVIVE